MNSVGARQGHISLKIQDEVSLYNAYMPFLKRGGLFAPTAQRYSLGDEVVLLITLISERLSVAGKVVWISPLGAQGNRTAGIGVHFDDTSDNAAVRQRIENMLASMLASARVTQTV